MSDYSEAWAEYRKLRNRALFSILGFLPGLAVVRWLVSFLNSPRIGEYLWFGAVIVWVIAALVLGARAQVWPCPRCGKRFAEKWWYHRAILFARRCANCGLEKYAQS